MTESHDPLTDDSRLARRFLEDPGWRFSPPQDLLPSVLGGVRRRHRRRVTTMIAGGASALVIVSVGGAAVYSTGFSHESAAQAAVASTNSSAKQALITALTDRQKTAPYNGGADQFHVTVVSSSSSAVSFTGRYRVWSGSVTEPGSQAKPAQPTNVLQFQASMARTGSSAWKLTSYTWTFAPGGGP